MGAGVSLDPAALAKEPAADVAKVIAQILPAARTMIVPLLAALRTAAGQRFVGEVVDALHAISAASAEMIGIAEVAGLRYPVLPYDARVDAKLYRGSRVDEAGMAALVDQGVRGIVNLCLENDDDAAPAAKLGLAALRIPILDNSVPTFADIDAFLAFVAAHAPAYVHCEAGQGRTGIACACYRIAIDGWSVDRALAEARVFKLVLDQQIAFVRAFAAR